MDYDNWLVIFDEKEILKTFHHKGTAILFIGKYRKEFFNLLSLVKKENWEKMPLPRPCEICKKRFQPFTRNNRICDACRMSINKKRRKCHKQT